MHSLIYLNLQFIATFSHDLYLQYKARVALDFPLLPLLFPPKFLWQNNLRYQRNHKKIDSTGAVVEEALSCFLVSVLSLSLSFSTLRLQQLAETSFSFHLSQSQSQTQASQLSFLIQMYRQFGPYPIHVWFIFKRKGNTTSQCNL